MTSSNPVVLLHGALGSKKQLTDIKQTLESEGFSVFFLNFSGHGGEPFQEEFGIEVFARDVIRFMDEHQLKKADFFGYSMGGYVALWLAVKHPKRVGKIITLGTKFDWSMESAVRETKKLNPEKIKEKVPAFARVLEYRHAPNDWKELMIKTSVMMEMLGSSPLLTEKILAGIRQEVLVLLGDQDDMADIEYTAKVAEVLPHGQFLLLENIPHPIEKINIDMIRRLLVGFLNAVIKT